MDADVMLERRDAVATITLNRPSARNAFGWDSWVQLEQAVRDADGDRSIRAIVLTGANGYFSSGGDLKTMRSPEPGLFAPVARLRRGHSALAALRNARKPTVAAVEGFAVGVGWSVALACDFVVAADDAFFSAPFLQRGLVPDGGLIWLLRQRVGEAGALNILLRGERVTAAQAHSWGLLSKVVPGTRTQESARDMAVALADLPADAVTLTKQLLRRSTSTDYAQFLAAEETSVALNFYGKDAAEGISSFVEKRPPRFNRHDDSDALEDE